MNKNVTSYNPVPENTNGEDQLVNLVAGAEHQL
jgi:hypothetical protein